MEAKRAAGDMAPLSWKAKEEEEEEVEGDVALGPVKRWTSDMNSLGFAWMILGETVYIMTGGRGGAWWGGCRWGIWPAGGGATGGFLILWESFRTLSGAGRGPWSSLLGDRPEEKSGISMAAMSRRW